MENAKSALMEEDHGHFKAFVGGRISNLTIVFDARQNSQNKLVHAV
jgi:hypothetical protein